MADNTIVHIGENSPEQLAYNLMKDIASVEGKALYESKDRNSADRKWILNTYAECLYTVRGFRDFSS